MSTINLLFALGLGWTATVNATPNQSACKDPIELVEGDVEVPDIIDPNVKPHKEHRYIKVQFCANGRSVKEIALERTARDIGGRRTFSEISARIYPDKSGVLVIRNESSVNKPQGLDDFLSRFTEYSRYDASGKEVCHVRLKGMMPDAISKNGMIAFGNKLGIDEAWWKARHTTPYPKELSEKRLTGIDGACRIIYDQHLPADTPNQSRTVYTISDNGRWAAYLHGTSDAVYVDKLDLAKGTRKVLLAKFGGGALDDSGRFYSQSMVSSSRFENGKLTTSNGPVIKYFSEDGDKLIPVKE